jgi:hypothetical protein
MILFQAHFCTELPLGDLQVVRQCRAELHEPQDVSRDDFTKFVSTLALSTHVNASLTNVDEYDRVAIQVSGSHLLCVCVSICLRFSCKF